MAETGLWRATNNGQLYMVQLLLDNDADVNAKGHNEWLDQVSQRLPRESVAFSGNRRVVEVGSLLLYCGAGVDLQCRRPTITLDAAMCNDGRDAVIAGDNVELSLANSAEHHILLNNGATPAGRLVKIDGQS